MNAIWFRNDLRVRANPAINKALSNSNNCVGFYVYTPDQHRLHNVGAAKLRFLLESVAALSTELAKSGISLIVVNGSTFKESVTQIIKLCHQHKVTHLFANEETELNERARDEQAKEQLVKHNIQFCLSQDQTICAPGSILTGANSPYRVFTPFKRAWIKTVSQHDIKPTSSRSHNKKALATSTPKEEILTWELAQASNHHWPAGSNVALKLLDNFIQHKASAYKEQRDFPGIDATSKLSPYLAVGAISIKQCLFAALEANRFEWDSGNQGLLCWINELIWREFYKHLSVLHPELSKGEPFQENTKQIPWNEDAAAFQQWCEGNTGYPLVDAAMRQLNTLGWMHNRLRMVVAMFLTKHLFIHWRWGERYFMEQLIDSDYAANNGGWQWSASTGADAAPYFRIFNPTRQSERFDPQGDFIRTWVPELATVSNKEIHNPNHQIRQASGYPLPMVDHSQAVAYAKEQFKLNQGQP